jgi:hypothetical protein
VWQYLHVTSHQACSMGLHMSPNVLATTSEVTSRSHIRRLPNLTTSFQALLGDSKYAGDVDNIAQIFDTSAKLSFRGETFVLIKFGTKREQDLSLSIRNGQLKIPG